MLAAQFKSLQSVVPKHVTAERLARVGLFAINRDKKLLECSPASIVEAIMRAAQLGFEVNDGTGRAWMVPRFSKRHGMQATYMTGAAGYAELLHRSGQVKMVYSHAVFEGDQFSYKLGLHKDLEHVPRGNKNPAQLTHAYGVIHLLNGGYDFVVLTREDIERARAKSSSPNNGPWMTDYEAMACKTALIRVAKYAPKSAEVVQALTFDHEADSIVDADVVVTQVATLDALTEQLEGRTNEDKDVTA